MQLEKISAFRAELAIAETFDEMKHLESKVSAIAEFARLKKMGKAQQDEWGVFRVQIEEKKGKWLDEYFPQGVKIEFKSSDRSNSSMKDHGIKPDESSNARLVNKEDKLVAEAVDELKQNKTKIVTPNAVASIVRKKKKRIQREMASEALTQKNISIDDTIQIECGDFRKLSENIDSQSIDAIITDTPYPYEYIELWSDLSDIAYRILKPSGFLIAYTGKLHLYEVMERLNANLEYYWLMNYKMTRFPVVHPRRINVSDRTILIFQKPPIKAQDEYIFDSISSKKPEKDKHKWQQSEEPFEYLIEKFTKPNDLIYEPFLGSGTTAICAKRLYRRCIGHEIDIIAFQTSEERISDAE